MTNTDRLIDQASRYPAGYRGTFAGGFGDEPPPAAPGLGVAVVACMDARIDVYSLLGLSLGEAHVIRNAGGLVTDDALRSLVISQRFLGTEEVVLVHHTRCGMQGLDDAALLADLERQTGERPPWAPGGFADPYEDVRRSAEAVRSCPWMLQRDRVRGFVFDVVTGRLEEVA